MLIGDRSAKAPADVLGQVENGIQGRGVPAAHLVEELEHLAADASRGVEERFLGRSPGDLSGSRELLQHGRGIQDAGDRHDPDALRLLGPIDQTEKVRVLNQQLGAERPVSRVGNEPEPAGLEIGRLHPAGGPVAAIGLGHERLGIPGLEALDDLFAGVPGLVEFGHERRPVGEIRRLDGLDGFLRRGLDRRLYAFGPRARLDPGRDF